MELRLESFRRRRGHFAEVSPVLLSLELIVDVFLLELGLVKDEGKTKRRKKKQSDKA